MKNLFILGTHSKDIILMLRVTELLQGRWFVYYQSGSALDSDRFLDRLSRTTMIP